MVLAGWKSREVTTRYNRRNLDRIISVIPSQLRDLRFEQGSCYLTDAAVPSLFHVIRVLWPKFLVPLTYFFFELEVSMASSSSVGKIFRPGDLAPISGVYQVIHGGS